jgi:SAM-dependent methyltransferase
MSSCRSCGNPLGKPFLSLGNSPVSNAFLDEAALRRPEIYYPLEVYVCPKCFLVQLEELESAQNIFTDDYAYFSSYSESWLQHCQNYVAMIMGRLSLTPDSQVIEIGSNDGYLLQYFRERGVPVLGVDPASNTAEIAIQKGIPTDTVFFNRAYAKQLSDKGLTADLIIGNNVLAHNPDLNDFVAGFRYALKPNGVITMEFPHLVRLIMDNQFDTIYQEHFSYLSLYAVNRLFTAHALTIFDVDEIPTHGGSLRIYAAHAGDESKTISAKVPELLAQEARAGLLNVKTYECFREKVQSVKRDLLHLLITVKEKGRKIVGYGAPAKGNTLLNFCGIGTDFLDYTVDRNPYKQGKYLPGTHIPIQAPDRIKADRPDYILILPWNIKDEIVHQLQHIREWHGQFILPIPEVKVF